MTNVGESYQFRLAKERKELLDKFIPAKRALQEKLRQQQDLKTDFSTSAKKFTAPQPPAILSINRRSSIRCRKRISAPCRRARRRLFAEND